MTSGYRKTAAKDDAEPNANRDAAKAAGNLKAGTIMVAIDPTGPSAKPCLIQVQGGKDADSWKAFFASLEDSPEWVIGDLDPAIARAVRETWPKAILYHSRRHLAERMRGYAIADGVPERVRLDEPIRLSRPIPWSPSRSTVRYWGDHPLMTAIAEAQRGPEEWARLKDLIAVHVGPDKLALRSWIATNEILVQRQWEIRRIRGRVPLSTGSLESGTNEWVAPLRRRAGRWQNARRLNLPHGQPRPSIGIARRVLPVVREGLASNEECPSRRSGDSRVSSSRDLVCDLGHELSAVIFSRTLSQTGCPECYKLTATERNKVARQRSRQQR